MGQVIIIRHVICYFTRVDCSSICIEDLCLFSIWTGSRLCYRGSQKRWAEIAKSGLKVEKSHQVRLALLLPFFFTLVESLSTVHRRWKLSQITQEHHEYRSSISQPPVWVTNFFFWGGGVKSTEFSFYRHFKGKESKNGDLLILLFTWHVIGDKISFMMCGLIEKFSAMHDWYSSPLPPSVKYWYLQVSTPSEFVVPFDCNH